MTSKDDVIISEVGARDGLQTQPVQVSSADKISMIEAFNRAGLQRIEVTSFVHPKVVPQMADAEAVLSGMVTFGIQGVMLIVAWLIGESFAVGMNQIAPDGTKRTAADTKIGMVLGVALVGLIFYWFAQSFGGMSASNSES